MTDTEKIFSLSKVNGADYHGELLPIAGWEFPKDTWLQRRLEALRKERTYETDNRTL